MTKGGGFKQAIPANRVDERRASAKRLMAADLERLKPASTVRSFLIA